MRAEEKFKAIVENALDGIIVVETETLRFIECNPTICKMLGYTLEESLKLTTSDIHPKEQYEQVMIQFRQQLQKINPLAKDIPVIRKDGSVFYCDVNGFPIDINGKESMVGFFRDITERKNTEEALNRQLIALTRPLETSEIAFNDLYNIDEIQKIQDAFSKAMNIASIITQPDGTPITTPSNFCTLCTDIIRKTEKGRANCFTSEATIGQLNTDKPMIQTCLSCGLMDAGASISVGGKHIANWLIGQVRNSESKEEELLKYATEIDADIEAYREALKKTNVMPLDQFRLIADFLFLLANELSTRAYQNIQQARFITDLKKTEENLKTANRQLEDIIEFYPDATHIVDKDLKIIAWNRAMEDMTGMKKSEMIGKGHEFSSIAFYGYLRPYLIDLLDKEDPELETNYKAIRRKGKSVYSEVFAPKLHDGKGAYVWAIASPLFDSEGQPRGSY